MNFDPKKTIFLIDGSSFLYRAYYGLRPLHTPDGVPVQAVFSFCRMIKKLIDTYAMEYVALVWDSRGKTTRHEMYSEYKATRQAAPSDLFTQKEYIVEFADLIGMRQIAHVGIEADDIMYSLAKEFADNNTIVLITLDKDMGQALTLGTTMYMLDAFKEKTYDRASLETKYEFPLEKMPFYHALLGDASDNIPGVKGIGQKTAIALVNQFNSLEDMYTRLHEINKRGVTGALIENKENAFLSYDLFLLQYHATGLKKEDLFFNATQWSNAKPLFQKLNFKSLLLQAGQTKEEADVALEKKIDHWKTYNFKTVTTKEELVVVCEHLKEYGAFAIDTETTGLQALEVSLVGISVCATENVAYYIPCGHKTDQKQLSQEQVIVTLKPLLEDKTYKKYLHHAKYDQLVLSVHGIELAGVEMDTLIAANLLTKEWQSASLKKLSYVYFQEDMLTYDDVVKKNKHKDFSYVLLGEATLYSAADSLQTVRLATIFAKEFEYELKLQALYKEIEHPLIQVLYKMEKRGIYLDIDLLRELDKKVMAELVIIEEKIAAVLGKKEINLNSTRQIEELLFEKLQLPPQKKSPKGRLSTDIEVLRALANMHPIPGLIIKYRELTKLKNTYIDALPNAVNSQTGRIHTTFSQTTAATGRLASTNPNLQNIPASGYGIEVRAAFRPEHDTHVFISADYSQIELRVLAYLSQDTNLINAFLSGHDIHRETAMRLFSIASDQVTHGQRQIGKRINFSVLYGLTPYGLSKDLGISFKDAKQYIEKYFEQYPLVSVWMNGVIARAKECGYVETLWGRRRYIPQIHEKNRNLYEEACRIAINTVAQGTAAEVMKKGMIQLDSLLTKNALDAHILLQIHDELLISSAVVQKDECIALTKEVLESVVAWNVPLVVTTHCGVNWKDVTK